MSKSNKTSQQPIASSKHVEGSQVVTDSSSKMIKNVIAFLLAIMLIGIVKHYNKWFFTERVMGYWEDYKEQRYDMDIENRKLGRWGSGYYISTQLVKFLRQNKVGKDDVVLLPSSAYFKASGLDFHVPEPSVMYYICGLKTVWQNCTFTTLPKWYCYFSKNALVLQKIDNRQQLDSILTTLKPYPASL